MMRIFLVWLLGSGAIACFFGAWLSNRRWTRELNELGRVYGCSRWPDETNNSYHLRLRARIGFR